MTENNSHNVKTPTFLALNTHSLTYRKEFPRKVWLPNQSWEQKDICHSCQYYNAVKPIFVVLTLCGIFPAFKARGGVPKWKRYFIAVYTVLVYSAFAVLSGYTYMLIIETSSASDIDWTHTLAISTQSLILSQQLLFLFVTWKESDYFFEYMEEWNKLQQHFISVTGESINLTKLERRVKVTSPLSVFWIVFGILNFYLFYDNLTLTMSIVFGYQMLNIVMVLKLWVLSYLAISCTTDQYEKYFSKKCISSQSDHQLQEYRLLWLHITNVMRQSGDMLSSTISYFNLIAYTLNIISAYSFIYNLVYRSQNNSNYIENMVITGSAFFFTSGAMFLFYNAPYITAQKCIGAVKPHLSTMKPTKRELLNEVQLFIQTIRLVPPECNLRGFSSIDRNSFLLGFGTRLTYLIILLQFNISFNEVRILSAPATPSANLTATMT